MTQRILFQRSFASLTRHDLLDKNLEKSRFDEHSKSIQLLAKEKVFLLTNSLQSGHKVEWLSFSMILKPDILICETLELQSPLCLAVVAA